MLFILVDFVCSNHLGIVEGDVSLLCHDKSSLNHQFGTYVHIFQTIFSRLKSLNNHTSTLPETNSKFPLKEAGSQKGKSSKPSLHDFWCANHSMVSVFCSQERDLTRGHKVPF